jgi:hypothetical protein
LPAWDGSVPHLPRIVEKLDEMIVYRSAGPAACLSMYRPACISSLRLDLLPGIYDRQGSRAYGTVNAEPTPL